jgi:hypothetical protein
MIAGYGRRAEEILGLGGERFRVDHADVPRARGGTVKAPDRTRGSTPAAWLLASAHRDRQQRLAL